MLSGALCIRVFMEQHKNILVEGFLFIVLVVMAPVVDPCGHKMLFGTEKFLMWEGGGVQEEVIRDDE